MPPIPTRSPTPEAGDPLARKMDGVGLRVNILRGLSTQRPIEREFMTRGELGTRLRALFDEYLQEFEETQALYVALGILDREDSLYDIQLALLGEGVLGYYDPEEEKFFLVLEEGQEFGPAEEVVYAHEYVHGLQQQHFDIHSTHERLKDADNTDLALAFQALREGDAYLLDAVYANEHMEPEEQAVAEQAPSAALIRAFRAAPHVIQRSYIYVFQEGLSFALALARAGGFEAVTAAFGNLPVSTEQVLHPDKYFSGELPVEVMLPDLLGALGEGWSEVLQDTMGEFLLRSYMETGFSPESASVAAEGWGGDRLRFYKGPQGEQVLVLSAVWDTEKDAGEFFQTFMEFTQVRTGGRWAAEGDEPTSALMTLDDQVISIGLEGVATLLVFAPDVATVDRVMVPLEHATAE